MALHAGRRHPVQDAPTGHALGVLQLKVGASLEAVGPCQAGGGYDREMNQKRGASGPEQSVSDQAEIELFEGFRAAGLEEERAMRTVQAVRVQAGHSIKETLEVHQAKVDTRVDGVETNLTAKIDGVEKDLTAKIDGVETNLTAKIDGVRTDLTAKIDGVRTDLTAKIDGVEKDLTAKIDGVEKDLTAKIDGVETNLTAKIDGVRTDLTAKIDGVEKELTAKIDGVRTDLTAKIDGVETKLTAKIDRFWTDLTAEIKGVRTDLKAEIATRSAEMKAIKRELAFIRWLLIILIAFLTLLVAYGLIPKFDRWPWQDATPEQSTSTPVASDPTQTGVPPEPDLQEPSPPE